MDAGAMKDGYQGSGVTRAALVVGGVAAQIKSQDESDFSRGRAGFV